MVAVCKCLYAPVKVVQIDGILFNFGAANSHMLQNMCVY